MSLVPSISLRQLLLALCLLAGGAAHAQWVVYEAVFLTEEATSVNFAPYSGAYIIAPAEGGTASMVFTTEADGRVFTVSENTGRYFIAANKAQRRAVFSAMSQNGTARAMYQASGLLSSSLAYNVGNEHKNARVPSEINGTMMASDDESSSPGPAADGSIGMAGSATMTAVLRVDLSRILNSKPSTMTDAVEMITKLLQQYGYLPDGSQPPPDLQPVVPGQATASEEAQTSSEPTLAPDDQPQITTPTLPNAPVNLPPAQFPDPSLFPVLTPAELDRAYLQKPK